MQGLNRILDSLLGQVFRLFIIMHLIWLPGCSLILFPFKSCSTTTLQIQRWKLARCYKRSEAAARWRWVQTTCKIFLKLCCFPSFRARWGNTRCTGTNSVALGKSNWWGISWSSNCGGLRDLPWEFGLHLFSSWISRLTQLLKIPISERSSTGWLAREALPAIFSLGCTWILRRKVWSWALATLTRRLQIKWRHTHSANSKVNLFDSFNYFI